MRWWSFLVDNAHHLRRTLKIFVIYFVRIQKLWTTVCYNKPSIFDKCIVYILKINGRFNCHFDLKTKNFISHSHVIILIPSSTDDTNTGLTLVQLLPWNLTNQTISKKRQNLTHFDWALVTWASDAPRLWTTATLQRVATSVKAVDWLSILSGSLCWSSERRFLPREPRDLKL